MRRMLLTLFCLLIFSSASVLADQTPTDTPARDAHADAIRELQDMGILMPLPEESYRADYPVTRQELAVVVRRMMEYYEASLPSSIKSALTPNVSRDDKSTETSAENPKGPPQSAPAWLQSKGVQVPSAILTSPDKPATAQDVATVLASAFTRLIEAASPGYGEELQADAEGHRASALKTPSQSQ
ncbi:MAG: hypothetical protein IT209_09245 [Armatimonadetes bacterium]|nr:hypothetical protein [Armatimonadota bacterium]